MRKIPAYLILSSLFLGLAAKGVRADDYSASEKTIFQRDHTYEEDLRWQASDDQTITPTRVLRWISGMRGSAVFAPSSSAEFQPIVNVHDSQVRAIATIAFKF